MVIVQSIGVMMMKVTKSYLDYLNELKVLEEEDRKIFFKLKKAREIHCDKFDKMCLFVSDRNETCFKECQYYQDTIKPLEEKSLQMLVDIANKNKEIK